MSSKFRHLVAITAAATATVAGSSRIAVAGSESSPGLTTGLAVYAPIPEGLYLINQTVGGIRTSRPEVASSYEVPFFYYQSPLNILGAGVAFAVAPTLYSLDIKGSPYLLGLYNTYVASQLTWDLGGGLGVGYRLGGYIPSNSEVGYNVGVIEQRAGVSYVGNDWNLTASFQYGTPLLGNKVTDLKLPDYLNLDLTATKKFGKWELGAVAFGSTDLNRPVFGYKKQGQFAAGGLVGYDFGPVVAQVKVTTDVVERNYGGRDTRAWLNLIIPLWVNAPPPVAQQAIRNRS